MADCEFNYRLCQLASQFSSNRVDDDLTMQELPKRSETLCQVWAITNRLYIKMQGPIID